MTTRIVEGKLPYTGGTAIEIDENKVISLRLRDENNLIIYDGGDNEIFVDLQLDDEITPTSAFPVGITTGRVVVDNGWDLAGTIICAKTTSGDNIKLLYADEGTLWIDNGTGTFKQIYFKGDVDTIVQAIYSYIDDNANTKTFFITGSSTQRKEKLGEAISYILSGKNALVNIGGTTYTWIDFVPGDVELGLDDIYTFSSAVNSSTGKYWELKVNVVYTNPHSSTVRTYTDTEHSVGGGGSDIEYVTQAEYNALLPGALTDNKHYFIYEEEVGPTPPTPPFTPGVNTIAYYELNGDATDSTGNYDGTASNVTYTTLASGIDVATFNGSNSKISIADPLVNNLSTFTVNIWVNDTANNFGNSINNQSSDTNGMFMDSIDGTQFRVGLGGGSSSNSSLTLNTWHNVVLVYNNGTYTVYFDNQQVHTETFTYRNGTNMTIGCRSQAQDRFWTGYISKVIFENKARIVQEIADYYNQTKANYGIS